MAFHGEFSVLGSQFSVGCARLASREGGVGPLPVSSIFLGFCYKESAKKFGERVFFLAGRGIRSRVSGRDD